MVVSKMSWIKRINIDDRIIIIPIIKKKNNLKLSKEDNRKIFRASFRYNTTKTKLLKNVGYIVAKNKHKFNMNLFIIYKGLSEKQLNILIDNYGTNSFIYDSWSAETMDKLRKKLLWGNTKNGKA